MHTRHSFTASSVPAEFRHLSSDLRIIAEILNDYLRESDIDVPGSRAAVEYSQETNFADGDITDPIGHIMIRAQNGLIASIDHMLGIAACIEASRVAFAPFSLLRPVIVGAGISYYLLDPGVSLRERLRRGWNFELESVREQLNGIDKEGNREEWLQVAQVRYRYLRWGARNGYARKQRNDRFGERRYWFSDGMSTAPPPSEIRLADDVLATVGDGSIGRAAYKFSSAFIHNQSHAFSVLMQAPMMRDIQTPATVPLGVPYDYLTTWLAVMAAGLDAATQRCGGYFGWDMTRWNSDAAPIFVRWLAA